MALWQLAHSGAWLLCWAKNSRVVTFMGRSGSGGMSTLVGGGGTSWQMTWRRTVTPRFTGWSKSPSAWLARKAPWVRMPARSLAFALAGISLSPVTPMTPYRADSGPFMKVLVEVKRSDSLPVALGPRRTLWAKDTVSSIIAWPTAALYLA